MKRRKYTPEFKKKIAIEAIREHRTVNEIASAYEEYPVVKHPFGIAEQDPLMWWTATKNTCKQVVKKVNIDDIIVINRPRHRTLANEFILGMLRPGYAVLGSSHIDFMLSGLRRGIGTVQINHVISVINLDY